MIKMNRNNVGLFRWDGRGSLRDAAPCNQPGNRQLRPDDGNRGIDGNIGRLVHGEILRHLRAIGACLGFRRVRGIPILFAGVSFIHGNLQQKTTGHLIRSKNTTFSGTFFEEPKKEIETFGRNRQIQSFSTSHGRVIACQDSKNVSDSEGDLTSRARSARNASALRWQTISGRRLCPSEHLPHRFCSKRA